METKIIFLRHDSGECVVCAVIFFNGKEKYRGQEFRISISDLDYLIEHDGLL